ncbi:protein kinase [Streptomyces sp. NPDC056056]|uniref:protein kinase domain-containing protein n=1 Tax=Streptomyces sp. NPDC056056 TaxID=3345698 RepID=UPI0035DED175
MSIPALDHAVSLIVEARDAEQFFNGLRHLRDASGRSAGQIAQFAGMPRSSAYRFVSECKKGLPRKPARLEQFCQGCKLTPEQTKQVIASWSRLAGGGAGSARRCSEPKSGPPRAEPPAAETPAPQMLERLLDDAPGPPLTFEGVRDVHITYNMVPEPPDPKTRRSRTPRQLSSIAVVAAAALTIAVIIDLVTETPYLTRVGLAAGQAPLSQTALCAVIALRVGLGVFRRIGGRQRRSALCRLRSWPVLLITTATAIAAGIAVGSSSTTPAFAAATVSVMTWLVVALWFASIDLRELRKVMSHAPALAVLGLVFGAGTCVGIRWHGLPLAPAVLAGVLTAAAIVHFLGKVAAPLMDVPRAPISGTVHPAPQPAAESPDSSNPQPICEPWDTLASLAIETSAPPEPDADSPPAQMAPAVHRDDGEKPPRPSRRLRAPHRANRLRHRIAQPNSEPIEIVVPQPIHAPVEPPPSNRISSRGPSPVRKDFPGDELPTQPLPHVQPRSQERPGERRDPPDPPRRRADRRRRHGLQKLSRWLAHARLPFRFRGRHRKGKHLPPLPRRIPWAHPLDDLRGTSLAGLLGLDGADVALDPGCDCEHQQSAYEIIARIGRERAQTAGRVPRGPRTGTRFGPYRVQALLHTSSTGEIYEAYDTRNFRVVALNLLDSELGTDPGFRARMNRDLLEAAHLPEPHIAMIHDWGVLDGIPYIETGLLNATTLRSRLLNNGPLSPDAALDVVEQIGSAIDAAHDAGVVHRDINLSNILLAPSGFATLTGFGTAVHWDDAGLNAIQLDINDYFYAAPERLEARPVLDKYVDIYSLTCVLYACLTGTTPFAAVSKEAMTQAHLCDPPPRPSYGRPGVPSTLDPVIARGMAKSPRDRYTSAAELIRAARTALAANAWPPARSATASPPPKTMTARRTLPRRTPGLSAAAAIPGWAEKNGIIQMDPGPALSVPNTKYGWRPSIPANQIPDSLPTTGYRGMSYELPTPAPQSRGYCRSPSPRDAELDELREKYSWLFRE